MKPKGTEMTNEAEIRQMIEDARASGDLIYISPLEAAAAIGRSTETVRGWLRSGQLTGYKIRDRWHVPVVNFTDDSSAQIELHHVLIR
jgi:hypothetical protein